MKVTLQDGSTAEGTPEELSAFMMRYFPYVFVPKADWPAMAQLHAKCECPSAWFGILPPPCPVHNPAPSRTVTTLSDVPALSSR